MRRNRWTRIWALGALATTVAILGLPRDARAGGVEVFTPPPGHPALCKEGVAAPWHGGVDPRAIVVGCAGDVQFSTDFSTRGIYFPYKGLSLCHYAAAAGFGDIDGTCGHLDFHPDDGPGDDILRVVTFQHEKDGPIYVTGLVDGGVHHVRVNFAIPGGPIPGGRHSFLAANVFRVPRRLATQVDRPLSFFAAKLPPSGCYPATVHTVSFPGPSYDELDVSKSHFHYSSSGAARRSLEECEPPAPATAQQCEPSPGEGPWALGWLRRVIARLI